MAILDMKTDVQTAGSNFFLGVLIAWFLTNYHIENYYPNIQTK